MTAAKGFYLPLSLPRTLITDLMELAAAVPTVPVERRLDLGPLLAARAAAAPRPGWTAIFTKAWALVCARRPALRQAFVRWPWPRLYQHSASVASLAVERPYGGGEALFFLHLADPEGRSLADIDWRAKRFRDRPLEQCASVRRQLRLARLPRPLRRLLYAAGLSVGRWRARYFGTFGVSSYGGLGASSLHPLSPLTTTLNFGPIAADGGVDVRVVYDHRVLDGGAVARAMADLEAVLHGEVLTELRYLRDVGRPAA